MYTEVVAVNFKSIADARKALSTLCRDSQSRMERFVITNQGKPQSVLLGYEDYQGLLAAAYLLQNPAATDAVRQSIAQLDRGEGIADRNLEFEDLQKLISLEPEAL